MPATSPVNDPITLGVFNEKYKYKASNYPIFLQLILLVYNVQISPSTPNSQTQSISVLPFE
jgi:hypothetical protein